MPVLDFKEIAEAKGSSDPDSFELFARDFLKHLGFKTISHPNRGQDEGSDLIVEELRTGPGGETTIRWLVSCKHYAHSGRSVKPGDEPNIRERVETQNANGFMGFYSTLASSGLGKLLAGQRAELKLAQIAIAPLRNTNHTASGVSAGTRPTMI